MGERTVSFDRAAEIYDRTRVTDPEALAETLDLLQAELAGRDTILEIGAGTGALAVPLAEQGIEIVGIDVSMAMLGRLRDKSQAVPVAAADATSLPFADDAFGGAYARWVLHLIPAWQRVVEELCRVVRRGGVILIEPGGYRGDWQEIWEQIESVLGPSVRNVGLRADEDDGLGLDDAFARHGAQLRSIAEVLGVRTSMTLADFFREARARAFSWTWRIDEDALARGLDTVEAWAKDRYGADLADVTSSMRLAFRTYDLP
jgi:SAM-dependent methyltransferase